jgi:anti-sigma factor RsiW
MNCERIGSSLIPYLDGRASTSERRKVEEHLAACAACRTRAEEYRRLSIVLDEAPAMEPSLGFNARLRQRIAAEPKPRWWGWIAPSPRLAFSVAMLVALSLWISARPTEVGTTKTAQSEQDFKMIQDLRVLEDYDVLTKFDALSELPPPAQAPARTQQND